jgi:serine/threonine protein phosphatase 1
MAKGTRYVIGDIHGCIRSFRTMVTEKIKLRKEDTLYLLGDYIDRGPDSKGVLDFMIELQREKYDIRPIMGNHEYMLLKSLEEYEYFEQWMKNGSDATLVSFGIPPEKVNDIESVFEIPQQYIDFLCNLKFWEETEDFYFVHAGLAKGITKPTDDLQSLFWGRKELYNREILKRRILIHGHTPVGKISIEDRIFDGESRILNLDGGCVYKHVGIFGNLAGMNLDNFQLFFQENIED